MRGIIGVDPVPDVLKLTLSELRLLCDRATPGPWRNEHRNVMAGSLVIGVTSFCAHQLTAPSLVTSSDNAAFIAAARTWLPALIEVAALSKELSDPLVLARRFHEAYEWLAPSFGYRTRPESAKPWEEVPEQNRALMEAVCQELMTRLRAALARLDEVKG